MQQLQECASLEELPQLSLYPKISLSVETEDYSLTPNRNKHPIIASSTSLYILQTVEFIHEKTLFAQYLSKQDEHERTLVFYEMKKFYGNLLKEQKSREGDLLLRKGDSESEDKILDYFIWIWLKDMGYGTTNNRKYLQRMVRLELGEVGVYKFLKLYKALPRVKLECEQNRHLLIETCKNGWQFFIRSIIQNQLVLHGTEGLI